MNEIQVINSLWYQGSEVQVTILNFPQRRVKSPSYDIEPSSTTSNSGDLDATRQAATTTSNNGNATNKDTCRHKAAQQQQQQQQLFNNDKLIKLL
jgi:hypothetical protein